MKKIYLFALVTVLLTGFLVNAQARNTTYMLPIKNAMATVSATDKIDNSIKLYFANQEHPRVLLTWGAAVTNRKTNAFGKSDIIACNWAYLSAIVQLQKRARKLGGNAVINIASYYNKIEKPSTKVFECHAGAMVAGVALKGEVVKLAK